MLLQLDDTIIARIVSLLPQQSLINLALTNYRFYEPCISRLYQHITIVPGSKLNRHATRKLTFQESTIIYGLNHVTDHVVNQRMVKARVEVLSQSLEINTALGQYCGRLCILGDYDAELESRFVALIGNLPQTKVYIENDELRRAVKSRCQFNSIVIDAETEVPASDEVEIRCEKTSLDLSQLKSVVVKNTGFYKTLQTTDTGIAPETINIDRVVKGLSFKNIKNLEIAVHEHTDLFELTANVPLRQLRKLVIYEPNVYDHNVNEAIDLHVLDWLAVNIGSLHELTYFAIIYNPPPKGEIVDGFEGNYLKKLEVLVAMIKVFDATPKRVNLVLPNYLEVLTLYEQPMNNLMWNGCKCDYCAKYLHQLDDFINFHKYYDPKLQYWKDLNNPVTLHNLSQYFSSRYTNTNNFEYISGLQVKDWDFHKNTFSPIQFQCFYLQTVYESDYNEDYDIWFDSLSDIKPCQYTKLFSKLNVCMVHYLSHIVDKLVNLDRGEAESREIHQEDMNDGDEPVGLINLYLNGFQFVFDRELNGTNFFESYYD